MSRLVREFRKVYYILKDFFAGHGGKLFVVETDGRIYAALAVRNLGRRIINLGGGSEITLVKIATLTGHLELLDGEWLRKEYDIPAPKFDFGWEVAEHRFFLEMVEREGRKRRIKIYKLGLEKYFRGKRLSCSLLRKARKILKGPSP